MINSEKNEFDRNSGIAFSRREDTSFSTFVLREESVTAYFFYIVVKDLPIPPDASLKKAHDLARRDRSIRKTAQALSVGQSKDRVSLSSQIYVYLAAM